jgi:hypothetical protein
MMIWERRLLNSTIDADEGMRMGLAEDEDEDEEGDGG